MTRYTVRKILGTNYFQDISYHIRASEFFLELRGPQVRNK